MFDTTYARNLLKHTLVLIYTDTTYKLVTELLD